jgi:alkanesulfonate monooxygenase SsuD/methylene tetrahydromethanopterin reductase-like flavin-dependent oxidoreductase (luciferase family)
MQLDESISLIKAMWTEEYASFEGRYYKIKDAICNPKPIQKPHPLIMVGGSGEKYLLKVVAKHAERYNIFFGSPDEKKDFNLERTLQFYWKGLQGRYTILCWLALYNKGIRR